MSIILPESFKLKAGADQVQLSKINTVPADPYPVPKTC